MTPFRDPFRGWPRYQPWTKGRFAEKHLAGLRAVLADPPPDPGGGGDDRGILICGGGRYWPGVVVCVTLIRRLGCELPVEVWYRSSCEAVDPAAVRGLGVDLIDADAVMDRLGDTRVPRGAPFPGGFEAKVYALAHCGFRQALCLDADSYPVAPPCRLFEELAHAPLAFWEDLPAMRGTVKWHRAYPVAPTPDLPPVQTGHYLFDRDRGWPLLCAALWCAEHSDYYFHAGFSDQDCWRVGLAATGTPYRTLGVVRRVGPALVCDRHGRPAVVHRVNAKLFPGTEPRRDDRLPLEREAFELFAAVGAVPDAAPAPAAPARPPGCCP